MARGADQRKRSNKEAALQALKTSPRGRPSSFKPEYTRQVEKLCKLGTTDRDLCLFFNVSHQTVENWKKTHPEFFLALMKGKQEADANVTEAMYKNATGYDYYEEQAVKLRETSYADGKVSKVREYVQRVKLKRHQPADTTAQIFWSKNRRPDLWRDVKKIDSEPELVKQTYSGDEVLAKLRERGFVELEGEYTLVGEQDKSNPAEAPPPATSMLEQSSILKRIFPEGS
ncbi:hypothetical protein JQ615_26530 [Bradyrhizobium jicamae]|uniref:Terminase n=1 Tax=Bradyrhizobium jicamae TaxID=280332 RepID=A0ABS5FQ82_9BRAD|nr:hypothetical protein [Bradyrhizobium jicamae]MBR0798950.1 hypothetical protein [Bradyrhizobium jicamae]